MQKTIYAHPWKTYAGFNPNLATAQKQQSQDPWPKAKQERQKKINELTQLSRGDGKLHVVPKTDIVPARHPTSWPAVPPPYVARPGLLIALPWQESANVGQVVPHIWGPVPKLNTLGKQRFSWINSNPGHIDTRGLDSTRLPKDTTEKWFVSHDTGPLIR